MINKKISFVLPVVSQPRFHRRIRAFKDMNFNSNIFSFQRDYFEGEKDCIDIISLGKVDHGKYLKRILTFFDAFNILKKNINKIKESKLIYIFGLDTALFMILSLKLLKVKKPIIFEIADIRESMIENSFKSKFFRMIERKLINASTICTVTSPYYVEEYFVKKQGLDRSKFFVLENKLYPPIPKKKERLVWNGDRPIVIGLIGLLRCQWSFDILYELAKNYPDRIIIYIRGYLMNLKDFDKRINELDNIIYEGEFKSPQDLADIYGKIDISFVGNISGNLINGKWALPNRLYESLYYKAPMVAHKNSGVGKKVNEMCAGWTVDFFEVEQACSRIINITPEEYKKVYSNMDADDDDVVGTKDHETLIQKLLGGELHETNTPKS